MNSFYFIHFGNCCGSLDNFLYYLLSSHDLLNDLLDWDDFLNDPLNLFDSFSNVRNFLYDLFVLNVVHNFFFNLRDFLNLDNFLFESNYLLDYLRNLNRPLNNLSDGNNFLHDFFGWNWNFNGYNNLSFNFNHFQIFKSKMNYFFYFYISWHFPNNLNNLFNDNFIADNSFFIFWNFN